MYLFSCFYLSLIQCAKLQNPCQFSTITVAFRFEKSEKRLFLPAPPGHILKTGHLPPRHTIQITFWGLVLFLVIS